MTLLLDDIVAEVEKIQDTREAIMSKLSIAEAKSNTPLFEAIDATEKYLMGLVIKTNLSYN